MKKPKAAGLAKPIKAVSAKSSTPAKTARAYQAYRAAVKRIVGRAK